MQKIIYNDPYNILESHFSRFPFFRWLMVLLGFRWFLWLSFKFLASLFRHIFKYGVSSNRIRMMDGTECNGILAAGVREGTSLWANQPLVFREFQNLQCFKRVIIQFSYILAVYDVRQPIQTCSYSAIQLLSNPKEQFLLRALQQQPRLPTSARPTRRPSTPPDMESIMQQRSCSHGSSYTRLLAMH